MTFQGTRFYQLSPMGSSRSKPRERLNTHLSQGLERRLLSLMSKMSSNANKFSVTFASHSLNTEIKLILVIMDE